VSEDAVLAVAERWRRQLGLRRPVHLLTAEADWPPFAAGVLRPMIFLPSVLLRRAEPAVLESVVAHEMVHLRRLDPLWLRLAEAVCLLYYFFPLAWLAARRLAEERERLCDARVLAVGAVAPRTYAGSLLAVLRLHLEGGAAEPAFGHAKRRVAMRIRSILEPPARRPRPLFTLLGVVALALFLLPMAEGTTQAETAAGDGEAAAAAEMTNPLPGRKVTSPFGTRRDPFGTVTQEHRGVDVHVQPGDLVRSSADGVVEVATEHFAGGEHYGTVVIVDHGDDLKSFYSHLSSLAVKPGDTVHAGSVLGEAGSTGKVTGPHLHFEIWKVGDPINPADFVTDWQPADDGC
jgi:murein DD-endopeptidase MepM/ murein hydrolase activator NlpD